MNFLPLLLHQRSVVASLLPNQKSSSTAPRNQAPSLHALLLLLLSCSLASLFLPRLHKKLNKNLMAHGHGGQPQGDSPYCSFHPRELVIGVCAHCLKDRLLLLLAASATATKDKDDDHAAFRSFRPAGLRLRTSSISLPKVFALGSSFLQRLDSRHHHEADAAGAYSDDDTTSVASLDDSFISIKFEDNGKATWDKRQAAPVRSSSSSSRTAVVAVVEHVKRGGVTRWRKQVVGRLLQLARWKMSAAVVGVDGKKAAAAERSKARGRGWIRSLTRRRAADRPWSSSASGVEHN